LEPAGKQPFLEAFMQLLSISSYTYTGLTGKTRLTRKLAYLCLLFLIFSSGTKLLQAQAIGSGQIQGTINDANGSAVAGATVEAAQQDSGLHRTVTSSSDGGYNLPDLPVGPYQLKVSVRDSAHINNRELSSRSATTCVLTSSFRLAE